MPVLNFTSGKLQTCLCTFCEVVNFTEPSVYFREVVNFTKPSLYFREVVNFTEPSVYFREAVNLTEQRVKFITSQVGALWHYFLRG